MSVNGFVVNGTTHHYNYNSLDNKPDFQGLSTSVTNLLTDMKDKNIQFIKNMTRKYANNSSGMFTINIGGIFSDGDTTSTLTTRLKTYQIGIGDYLNKNVAFVMDDDTYLFYRAWTYQYTQNYSSFTPVRRLIDPARTYPGSDPFIFDVRSGEDLLIVSFALASDLNHEMTDEDISAVSNSFKIYYSDDLSSLLDERTLYSTTAPQFITSPGGLNPDGTSNSDTTRIRYRTTSGIGAFQIGKDSIITPADGYKCDIALYSRYVSASDFDLSAFYPNRISPLTIPYDCYARIDVATSGNATLWSMDENNSVSYTPTGLVAFSNGISFQMAGSDVKSAIDSINKTIASGVSEEIVYPLKDEIPLNAVDYHALYDKFVTDGFLTRELLGVVDNDQTLPVYMYKLRADMAHISPSYSVVAWDGSNELYSRPRIMLTSGVHGNERATPFVLFDFIRNLISNSNYKSLCNAFEWYFIPLVNPWGFGHSEQRRSDSVITYGGNYTTSTLTDYNALSNTSSIHQGIRCNKDGVDINRDFASFVTVEAQYVRSALNSITSDGRKFLFAMDSHQASYGNSVTAIGAFLSMSYRASEGDKDFVYGKWMQAGGKTEKAMADYCDVKNVQSVYCWEGSNLSTLRNYFEGYSMYSTCLEGAQNAVYYGNNSEWSNEIARTFVNTQYQGFMRILGDALVSKAIDADLPAKPSSNGTYSLKITVNNGTIAKAWVRDS